MPGFYCLLEVKSKKKKKVKKTIISWEDEHLTNYNVNGKIQTALQKRKGELISRKIITSCYNKQLPNPSEPTQVNFLLMQCPLQVTWVPWVTSSGW